MHGCLGSARRVGDLFIGQAAEIMQLDDLRQARLELNQALERVVERDHIEIHRRSGVDTVGKHVPHAGVAFGAGARLGVIDQDAAHQPRGKRKKMLSVL